MFTIKEDRHDEVQLHKSIAIALFNKEHKKDMQKKRTLVIKIKFFNSVNTDVSDFYELRKDIPIPCNASNMECIKIAEAYIKYASEKNKMYRDTDSTNTEAYIETLEHESIL